MVKYSLNEWPKMQFLLKENVQEKCKNILGILKGEINLPIIKFYRLI